MTVTVTVMVMIQEATVIIIRGGGLGKGMEWHSTQNWLSRTSLAHTSESTLMM